MKRISNTLRRRLIAQRRDMLCGQTLFSRSELIAEAARHGCPGSTPDPLDRVLLHRWWIENSHSSTSSAEVTFAAFRAANRMQREAELKDLSPRVPSWADSEWAAEAWATMQDGDFFEVSLSRALSRISFIERLVDAGVTG
ncbi:MAG: hypothetical protein R3F30_12165 [Planctomycetota bacterium]